MLALNDPVTLIIERFGPLAYRLIEDEMVRAIARADEEAADAWQEKLREVNAYRVR